GRKDSGLFQAKRRAPATTPAAPHSRLEWRGIARIDGLRQERLLVVGPELADVAVRLDGLVPKLEPVFGAFLAELADVEIADHVAEVVELDRSARGVGQVDRTQRRDQ